MLTLAARTPQGLPADWIGWAVIAVAAYLVLRWFLRLLGGGK